MHASLGWPSTAPRSHGCARTGDSDMPQKQSRAWLWFPPPPTPLLSQRS